MDRASEKRGWGIDTLVMVCFDEKRDDSFHELHLSDPGIYIPERQSEKTALPDGDEKSHEPIDGGNRTRHHLTAPPLPPLAALFVSSVFPPSVAESATTAPPLFGVELSSNVHP